MHTQVVRTGVQTCPDGKEVGILSQRQRQIMAVIHPHPQGALF